MQIIMRQSLNGKGHDMLRPKAEDIDFHEIANVLAKINRFARNAPVPVSVAQHTLIALEASPPALRPWVALHDAHEYAIGDITTPTKQALYAFAEARGIVYRDCLEACFNGLVEIHDKAIHKAAGLPLPSDEQRRAIHQIDLCALNTERRDFLNEAHFKWDCDHIAPLRKVFRPLPWPTAADALWRAFYQYLPVFNQATQNERMSAQ